MNDNASTQATSGPATLPEESPAKAKPLEAAKSRVANLLHAFAPKKKAAPEDPPPAAAAQENPVRPVIGSDRAALFLDSKGNIVAAQPRCAGLFGRSPDELSGLNVKDLLKPGFDEEVSNILTKGQQASEMSFHVLAMRKDGTEFQTQFSFKFLPEDFGFCWTVFVQAPPGYEFQQIIPTTETATQSGAPAQSGEKTPATPPVRHRSRNPEQLAAKLDAAQNECKRLERIKFEAEKRMRQMQTDYGNRVIQLEEDLSNERQINEQISKRVEAQEQSFTAQVKGMQKFKQEHPETAAAPDGLKVEFEELQKLHKTLDAEAKDLRQERDLLRSKLLASHKAGGAVGQTNGTVSEPQAQGHAAELTAKLEKASTELQALRKDAEENESGRKQLKADLEKERETTKLAQKKAEELNAQFQKLKGAADQAEARVRESVTKCSDWEKKVADLNKSADELSKTQAAGKTLSAQSAQRVKELEQQLKDANANLATGKSEAEKQTAARQKLEADNRTLTEANTKTKAELDKEREAIKLARKKEEELNAEVQKSQKTAEQSAAQSKDWEKKAADLKKSVDELTKNHATEKNAAAQSGQQVKDLEQQLKRAGDDLAARKTELEKQTAARQKLEADHRALTEANTKTKTDLEKQNSARQKVEAENRTLTEANSRTNADLDMERDAHKLFRQKAEELSAQVKNLQHAGEQAEARLRESSAQSRDWEKKAADLKKTVDELTKNHAAEKNSAAQSSQRVKELEQQLKRTGDDLTAGKSELVKQNSARQKLEAENRNLTEAGSKTKAELDKEREANKLSRQKAEELSAQVPKLQQTAEQAEARVRESAAQSKDWEKKATDLKKSVDELTRNHSAEKNAAAQSAQRVGELEQQLKRASDELAAGKAEVEKQQSVCKQLQAENRELTEATAKAKAELAVASKNDSVFEKRANELEQRVREGVSALAKATTDLQSERVERERAEKCASLATNHSQQLNEMLDRQLELERGYRSQIAELEKSLHDRGDDLARASAALRKETKERQIAQKQSRLVSDMGNRLESNLASLDDAKKVFEASLQEKDDQLQIVERSLKEAQAGLEKESTERRRLDGVVADSKRQLEKVSSESKVELSRLQAALDLLELQRKRLEGDLLRSSDAAKSAEQGIGVTLENLRLELRQAVEELRRSACSLLESKVTDEQKRVVETVLEKALFLQVTLNAGAKPEAAEQPQANGRKAESKKVKG